MDNYGNAVSGKDDLRPKTAVETEIIPLCRF